MVAIAKHIYTCTVRFFFQVSPNKKENTLQTQNAIGTILAEPRYCVVLTSGVQVGATVLSRDFAPLSLIDGEGNLRSIKSLLYATRHGLAKKELLVHARNQVEKDHDHVDLFVTADLQQRTIRMNAMHKRMHPAATIETLSLDSYSSSFSFYRMRSPTAHAASSFTSSPT